MAKIPRSPKEIFSQFTDDLKECFGDQLESIILYGSGARNEYVRRRSDINFLVILSEQGISQLAKIFPLLKKWGKRKVSVPLFLTREYIDSSLDSFPLEFISLQRSHELVYGTDVLQELVIEKDDLRLQCEEQIKSKLLHLRECFLQTLGRKKHLQRFLAETVPTMMTLFSGLLILRDVEPPRKNNELFELTAQTFDLEQSVFAQLLALYDEEVNLNRDELVQLAERYISQIRTLASIVDKL
ncbi:MAG TPA: nucleotidyltransferase domain-containing protein [bacterium]|nr:nucleotidyltransferase domain-containing protein [bacterium]